MYRTLEMVCERGHMLIELAYDERSTKELAEREIRRFFSEKLKPRCGLCGSSNMSVRERQTEGSDITDIVERFYSEQAEVYKKAVRGN